MDGLSVALALPSRLQGAGLLGDDFILNMTFPLPYGFAGIQGDTMGDTKLPQ